MRLSSRIILLISIVSAALAFSMTLSTLKKLQKGPASDSVVVAMKDLDVGAIITASDIEVLTAPSGTDTKTAFFNVEKVIGKNVRNPIRRGKVLSVFDIVSDGDDMTGLIPKGYRASTILIEIPREALNFLKFGNRVDVLFMDPERPEIAPKYIMRNILVLNVTRNESGSNGSEAYVTVAVRPEGIETLAYATRHGKVDLTVHPTTEANSKEEYMSYDELLGLKKGLIPAFQNQVELEVIRGVKKETVKI